MTDSELIMRASVAVRGSRPSTPSSVGAVRHLLSNQDAHESAVMQVGRPLSEDWADTVTLVEAPTRLIPRDAVTVEGGYTILAPVYPVKETP